MKCNTMHDKKKRQRALRNFRIYLKGENPTEKFPIGKIVSLLGGAYVRYDEQIVQNAMTYGVRTGRLESELYKGVRLYGLPKQENETISFRSGAKA